MLQFLHPGQDQPFPAVEEALSEPNGLLAAGGDLSEQRLLRAYRNGIFPWYEEGQPILWWSPDPRLVIEPQQLHLSRRLLRRLKAGQFSFSLNREFAQVIDTCAGARQFSEGTWITAAMREAYLHLHARGWAHSIEVWQHNELVGGIYGVAIGKAFFGESMFHRRSDASKAALARLCHLMQEHNMPMLDCQVASAHLISMGATTIPREAFVAQIHVLTLIEPQSPPFLPRAFGKSMGLKPVDIHPFDQSPRANRQTAALCGRSYWAYNARRFI